MSAMPNEIAAPELPEPLAVAPDAARGEAGGSPPGARAARVEAAPTSLADRGMPSLNRPRSIQTRLSRLMAFALLLALGSGLLGWYYQQTATRSTRSAAAAVASAHTKAEGESTVPPLEVGEPPVYATERIETKQDAQQDATQSPVAALAAMTPERPLFERVVPRPTLPARAANRASASVSADTQVYPVSRRAGDATPYAGAAMSGSVGGTAPVQSDFSRRLAGPAFASQPSVSASTVGAVPESITDTASAPTDPATSGSTVPNVERSAFAAQLKPTVLAAAQAKLLPSRRLLLPKGALIDCTLQTAIDSSLPGLTTCLTATPTFGADGRVVLLERGTTLVGETRGEARRGGKRLFVLWSEARTPTGVVVELASPATDALGRAGLTGEVDRHFWERFGAATVLSILDGAVQAGVEASRQQGSSAIAVSPAASRDILSEALHDTADITPTIRVAQGTRLQILVARDLDFRSVYALEFHGTP